MRGVSRALEGRNPKSEIKRRFVMFRISGFGLPSAFGFRPSDFSENLRHAFFENLKPMSQALFFGEFAQPAGGSSRSSNESLKVP